METLISKGQRNHLSRFYPSIIRLKAIGEELVTWKRRFESWVVSQTAFVKVNLILMTLSAMVLGSLALAQADNSLGENHDFEIYRSIRTVEAAVKGSQAIPQEESVILVAAAFDVADDYIKEIFATPVPNHASAAEMAVTQPLASPLPEDLIDNGIPPLPGLEAVEKSLLSTRNLLWPMRSGRVSSRFGMRWGRMHQGTDIAAPYGTPIFAAADGKVIFSGWEGGYGQLIIVDHENGIKTKYGHCSKRLVAVGNIVKQGDLIGKVGSSGNSTGPHLHYEVIREGEAKNPETITRRR